MSFKQAMHTMLPPVRSGKHIVPPHITSEYGEWRPPTTAYPKGRYHYAIDFNYVGGQRSPHNRNNPAVFSPVSGKVVFNGGRWGAVSIRDANGYLHKILHLDSRIVKNNQPVKAGQQVGTMGKTGVTQSHIHYQVLNPKGRPINPENFWKNRSPEANKAGKESDREAGKESGKESGRAGSRCLNAAGESAHQVAGRWHRQMAVLQEKIERRPMRRQGQETEVGFA